MDVLQEIQRLMAEGDYEFAIPIFLKKWPMMT